MFIAKCDICKKEIVREKRIDISFGNYKTAEFCEECALPVLRFLKKNKLAKEEKEKIKLS